MINSSRTRSILQKPNIWLPYLYAFIVIADIFNRSMVNVAVFTDAIRTLLIFIIFVISLFCVKHDRNEYIWLSVGLVIGFLTFMNTGDKEYFLIIILMFALSHVSFMRTCKLIAIAIFLGLFFIWLLSKIGFIANIPFERMGDIRWAMGMQSPIVFSAFVFNGLIAFDYLNFKNHPFGISILLVLIICLLDKITNSRNDEMSILFMIVIGWITLRRSKIVKKITSILILLLPFISMLSIYITKFLKYPSESYFIINSLLSGRLGIQDYLIKNYSVPMFGQRIIQTGLGGKGTYQIINYFYIDNSYARFLYMGGIIFFIFLFSTIIITLFKLNQKGYTTLALYLLLICFNGIWVDTFAALSTSIYIPFYFIHVIEEEKDKNE